MKKLGAAVGLVFLMAAPILAQGRFAIGTQFTFPALFGISVRYFPLDSLGLSGTVFLFSSGSETVGDVAARLIWLPVKGKGAGFYLAGGATLLLPDLTSVLHLVAGIEVAVPFAPAVWLNTEFGFFHTQELPLGMAFGAGIHYYFGPAEEDTQ